MAAVTRSAHTAFSSWLPAAISAPTPVSLSVHSSTLVTAGIYLLIRFSPSGYTLNVALLLVSELTVFIAGLGANCEPCSSGGRLIRFGRGELRFIPSRCEFRVTRTGLNRVKKTGNSGACAAIGAGIPLIDRPLQKQDRLNTQRTQIYKKSVRSEVLARSGY